MMNREEFFKVYEEIYGENWKYCLDSDNVLTVEWQKHGASGGNCWGDESRYFVSDELPATIDLEDFLERVCPAITFIQYKKLEKLIEESTRESYEYYGNYTVYGTKKLDLNKVFEVLKEYGYVQD